MNLSIKYLNSLIEGQVEESYNLEYKGSKFLGKSNKNIEKLSISVSSFANSNGGRLIVGIEEYQEKEKRHLPEKLSPIDINNFPKEWMEQVINDNIQPAIINLKITPIPITENTQVYIIDIPKSETAHQSKDLRYYRRHNFRKLPMADYEIRDILNRKKHPNITIQPIVEIGTTSYLILNAKNIGKKIANICKGSITLPIDLIKYSEQKSAKKSIYDYETYTTHKISNKKRVRVGIENISPGHNQPRYSDPKAEPILPHDSLEIYRIAINKDVLDKAYHLSVKILADESEPKSLMFQLSEIKRIKNE